MEAIQGARCFEGKTVQEIQRFGVKCVRGTQEGELIPDDLFGTGIGLPRNGQGWCQGGRVGMFSIHGVYGNCSVLNLFGCYF